MLIGNQQIMKQTYPPLNMTHCVILVQLVQTALMVLNLCPTTGAIGIKLILSTMIRCSDGYCCHNYETCIHLDSCHVGREGPLCGKCERPLTESWFTADCVPVEGCKDNLIISLYFICVIIYASILMASSYLQSKIPEILKKCYQLVKHRIIDRIRQFQNEKHNDSKIRAESSEKSQDSDQDESRVESSEKSQGSDQGESRAECAEKSQDFNQSKADSSDTKYIQILFYYIQDATLFKVHLPDDGHLGRKFVCKGYLIFT